MAVIKMSDIELSGKRVLIREDLNVPVADGVVTSDARIRAALPTIKAALEANAAVMLMSHLGRPTEGQPEDKFSLQPVADHLGKLLGRDVPLVKDWIDGVDVAPGDVVLLENVRFLAGEKKCDESLAKKICDGCFRHGAPGPGQYLWGWRARADCLCGSVAGRRTRCAGESAR
jgi:phosphoglycerate kinase